MIKRASFLALATAGVFALSPSLANAYTGVLINCSGGAPVSTIVSLKPGLTCTNAINKLRVRARIKDGNPITNCVANPAAPWAAWHAAKWTKVDPTSPAITQADIDIKASTYGNCNFTGDPTSGKAWGNGKVFFYAGASKIKGGPVKFSARVAGDLATQSAQAIGIVTKGLVPGATIVTQVPIDVANPVNGAVLGCNTVPGFCTPDPFGIDSKCKGPGDPYPCCTASKTGPCVPPANQLALFVNGTGYLQISYDANSDCTGAGTPYLCCTGAGTGTCN
jgi:hypothetical protein